MIRSRDFILFLVILLFLAVAIVGTVFLKGSADTVSYQQPKFGDTRDFQEGALATKTGLDRKSIIERLREKIAKSDLVIQMQPPQENIPEEIDNPVSVATLDRCLYPDDALPIVPKWPLKNVQVKATGAVRMVYTAEEVVVSKIDELSTSSQMVETTQTVVTSLQKLPLYPQKAPVEQCVPSEVIGVTNSGILMFNGDLRSYRGIGAGTLIGYARDGFPIYGLYDGVVDSCGGYDSPSGYRYTVSNERDYIIGCFVGIPVSFNL